MRHCCTFVNICSSLLLLHRSTEFSVKQNARDVWLKTQLQYVCTMSYNVTLLCTCTVLLHEHSNSDGSKIRIYIVMYNYCESAVMIAALNSLQLCLIIDKTNKLYH